MRKEQRYDQYMYSYPHKCAYFLLSRQQVRRALEQWGERGISLYLHIPFCSSKCGYCNLFSVAGADERKKDEYVRAVLRQMEQFASAVGGKEDLVSRVILGGGTPLSLSISQFETLFSAMENGFHLRIQETGVDVETSPEETTRDKLSYLKERGMRRVSIGIQSFCQKELESVYRRHSAASSRKALTWIKEIEPTCLNLDFIYGIPGQNQTSLLESLREALFYEPDEIFLYPLYVRKGTPLYGRVNTDERVSYSLYQAGALFLKEQGFTQTSMRRFVKIPAKPEADCGFSKMLSLGCGGRSYVGNLHMCEPYEVEPAACGQVLDHFLEKTDFFDGMRGYELDEDETKRRYVIQNLGYYKGVSGERFANRFGDNLMEEYRPVWESLLRQGSVCQVGEDFLLTEKGLGESDQILTRWISKKVEGRMEGCWKK